MLSSASEVSVKIAQKTASTFETLKQWSKSAYKCTRQIVSEKLGKSSRTVDPELESQIEVTHLNTCLLSISFAKKSTFSLTNSLILIIPNWVLRFLSKKRIKTVLGFGRTG
jgi:hypothetical protein